METLLARTDTRQSMSNGDDDAEDAKSPEVALTSRLDDAAESLDAAESESDLDEIEATLDEIESDLEDADLPEPDEDDEDAEDPREDLESRLADLRDDLEDQRGPYVEDVVESVSSAESTVADSEWTDDGEEEAVAAVESFLDAASEHYDLDADAGDSPDEAADALGTVADDLESSGLDPDEDEAVIAGLLDAAETVGDDLDAAETWDDLTVREQLDARGFYDVLDNENRKDFPPEWTALKIYAKRGDVEPMLFALDKLDDSDFMEKYVLDQLLHMGKEAQDAFDELHQRAQKRNKRPVRILGKMGDDRAAETLHDFIDGDGDPALQKITLRALGEMGSEESVGPVAQRLVAEDEEVRSVAARALGLLGDPRAIDPLADVLGDDEVDSVRASAAWALRQIGTEHALDVASEYTDDDAYLVQAEAEKAAGV